MIEGENMAQIEIELLKNHVNTLQIAINDIGHNSVITAKQIRKLQDVCQEINNRIDGVVKAMSEMGFTKIEKEFLKLRLWIERVENKVDGVK
jgi:hypothetical protein